MNLNFIEEFKNYSNLELLKIIKNPTHYQQAAVEAAQAIISTRSISQQEEDEIKNYFISIETAEQKKKEKILAYKSKIVDAFEPILILDEEVKPSKWVKALLIMLAVQYIYFLYSTLPRLLRMVLDGGHYFEVVFLVNCVVTVYFPVIFILLLRRKRWGWILLFADNIIASVFIVGQIIIYLYSFDFLKWVRWDSMLWSIFIRTAFLIFLLRKDITLYFNISRLTLQRAFMFAVLLALLLMAAVHYFY